MPDAPASALNGEEAPPPAVLRAASAGLLALLAALLVATSLGKHLSYDEPYHLAYGQRFLTEGPQVRLRERLPVVALSALACLDDRCDPVRLGEDEGRRLLVRAPTMLFALACGLLLQRWAAELLGHRAGLATLALYVLNPTVLAHGKQVTGDMANGFFTVAALYAGWRFARGRSPGAFLAAGAPTAGAALSKYTSLLLLPLVPALALACGGLKGLAHRRRVAVLAVTGTAAYGLGVLLLVGAAFRFDRVLTPASGVGWRSQGFERLAHAGLPLPVPVPYAQGLDFAASLQERGGGSSPAYVLGRRYAGGVWFAFPVMLALKTPLAFFALLALGMRTLGPSRRAALAFWLVPALATLAFFSLVVRLQIGVRYVLPSLLLLLPLAGAAFARAAWRPVATLGAWYALSSLSYLPHPMSYFNELIGPRVNAWRYLADSNLDWEDRRVDIARFRAAHPGLDLVVEPDEVRPGDLLIGANRLLGLIGDDRYRWLRRGFTPVGHVGYSYLLFHVPPGQVPRAGTGPDAPDEPGPP